jgi:hypothetical protein
MVKNKSREKHASVVSPKYLYVIVERFAVTETGTGFPLTREAVRDSSLRSRCSLRQNDRAGISAC